MEQKKYEKVRTAVIGCGAISDIYLHNLTKLLDIVEVVAVCDHTHAKAAAHAAAHGVPKVLTAEEIVADPDIELVVNLTGPVAHYDVLRQMLEAGKHVYTEKMFTTDIVRSRELIELAARKGLYIGVAPDTVLGAGIQTARNVLDMGLIGQITSGFVSVSRPHLMLSEVFRFLQNDGGALPYDIGVYYVGALVALLGPVEEITGFAAPALPHTRELLYLAQKKECWTIPGNNVAAAALKFHSGALISIHFDGNTAGAEQSRFELCGTKGVLRLGDPNRFDGEVKLVLPEAAETVFPFTHGFNGVNRLTEPKPWDGGGHRGIGVGELCYALRQGRTNRLNGAYGLHCQEVLQGIDIAAETGHVYRVKSTCEIKPLVPGHYSTAFGGLARGDAERSLIEG